jgi:Transposase, Mutator family
VRRTVPPSAEIQAEIDKLLGRGLVDDPQKMLGELARFGARLIIQRAVEDEFDTWLGRARYERRPETGPGKRNGFRPRHLQTGEGELEIEIPQVREAAIPFVSKPPRVNHGMKRGRAPPDPVSETSAARRASRPSSRSAGTDQVDKSTTPPSTAAIPSCWLPCTRSPRTR